MEPPEQHAPFAPGERPEEHVPLQAETRCAAAGPQCLEWDSSELRKWRGRHEHGRKTKRCRRPSKHHHSHKFSCIQQDHATHATNKNCVRNQLWRMQKMCKPLHNMHTLIMQRPTNARHTNINDETKKQATTRAALQQQIGRPRPNRLRRKRTLFGRIGSQTIAERSVPCLRPRVVESHVLEKSTTTKSTFVRQGMKKKCSR